MSDEPVATAGLESADERSHIERIDPGENPAYVPGTDTTVAALPLDRGPQRQYIVLAKSQYAGMLKRPGDHVMLYDDEVAAHHMLAPPTLPPLPEVLAPDPSAEEITRLTRALSQANADRAEADAQYAEAIKYLESVNAEKADLERQLSDRGVQMDQLERDKEAALTEAATMRDTNAGLRAEIAEMTKAPEDPPAAAPSEGQPE
jgi:hypothetical protein